MNFAMKLKAVWIEQQEKRGEENDEFFSTCNYLLQRFMANR